MCLNWGPYMAVDYANLFASLGKVGKLLYKAHGHADGFDDWIEELADAQDDQIGRGAIADLLTAETLADWRDGVNSIYDKAQAAAEGLVIAYVKADQPSKASSISVAIEELRRQMVVSSESVKAATVSVTPAALATNSGNGTLVSTVKRGDGKQQDLTVAEVGFLQCTTDSQTGGATERQETFTYAGEADEGDPAAFDWPTGSAGSATITVIDPTQDNSGGNVLTNSDFNDWTGSPLSATSWAITVGTYGTDVVREGTEVYDGTYSAKWVGGGADASIRQTITSVVLPQRSYAFNIMVKRDVDPAAGVMTIDIIDGTDTVVADDAGTNNTFTIDLTTLTTSFVAYNNVFRMPKLLPDTLYLRIRLSTSLSSGTNVFTDEAAMGLTTPLYDGGPSVAIFPGSTKWVAGDGWTLTMANNRGGASFAASFNALFDRFFGMRALAQLLPTDASPTRADTLISS